MKYYPGLSGANIKQFYQRRAARLSAVALAGVVGISILSFSQAASPATSFEAENGTLSGNVSVAADASASGGQAVAFASTGALSISIQGNHFVNQNGQTVQLRGVNRSGTQYVCAEGAGGVFD